MPRGKAVLRHMIADYLNVGTESKPEWALMGTGFTTLDESPGAQTESVKYVNEAEHIADEKAVDALYQVGRNHYIGSDAEFEYVRVEMWNKAQTGDNVFEARKFVVSCEVSDYSGENKQVVKGNLNAVGDPVLGTFDTTQKTFTEAAA